MLFVAMLTAVECVMNKEEYIDILNKCVMNISFIKKDGSERMMKCTLNKHYLPSLPLTEEDTKPIKKIRKENSAILSVFDLEKQDWRSIILENIISCSVQGIIVEYTHPIRDRGFEKFLSAAIKAEREACAKEVEEYQSTSVTRVIASRIRERGRE